MTVRPTCQSPQGQGHAGAWYLLDRGRGQGMNRTLCGLHCGLSGPSPPGAGGWHQVGHWHRPKGHSKPEATAIRRNERRSRAGQRAQTQERSEIHRDPASGETEPSAAVIWGSLRVSSVREGPRYPPAIPYILDMPHRWPGKVWVIYS